MSIENKDKINIQESFDEFKEINKSKKVENTIVYGLTINSLKLSLRLATNIDDIKIYMPKRLEKDSLEILENQNIRSKYIFYENKFKDNIKQHFKKGNKLIFLMAVGIVVRSIKDYIEDKFKDPAVIVCDELGINTISLLSGHVGNANEFSLYISEILNSNPIITTSTDINKKASFDLILKKLNGVIYGYSFLESKFENNLYECDDINTEFKIANENNEAKLLVGKKYFKSRIKYINRLLVENQKILILFDMKKEIDLDSSYYKNNALDIDYDSKTNVAKTHDKKNYFEDIENDNFFGIKNIKRQMEYLNLSKKDLLGTSYIINLKLDKNILRTYKHIILITNKKVSKLENFIKELIDLNEDSYTKVISKNLVLSIGCRKNKTKTEIKTAFCKFLKDENIDKNAILKLATVDVKQEEQGLIEFARDFCNKELNIVKRDEIRLYEDLFNKSEFVKKSIGVYSVSEPVAYIVGNNNLVVKKSKYNGITFSVSNAKME
ncbi:MAG: cobalamin biosynthesis protein [Peptostreptococcaceae bacterium]|jgi:cobalt-precorrin 5A hydrolase|nr:cobalamin biosynthesis protein [Peptostreptococcaceae bacterium]